MDGTADVGPLVASQAAEGRGKGWLLAENRKPFSTDVLWNVWNQYFQRGWLSYSSLAVRARVSPATWLQSSGDVLCFHPTRTLRHTHTQLHSLCLGGSLERTRQHCPRADHPGMFQMTDQFYPHPPTYWLGSWGQRSAIKILIVQRKREKYFFNDNMKELELYVRRIKDKDKTFPRGTFQKTKRNKTHICSVLL